MQPQTGTQGYYHSVFSIARIQHIFTMSKAVNQTAVHTEDHNYHLFVFIQVNPAMLLGHLRKLDTNITFRLPAKIKAQDV